MKLKRNVGVENKPDVAPAILNFISMMERTYDLGTPFETGHAANPSRIYTFPRFGNAQIALRMNKEKFSLYLRSLTLDGRDLEPLLTSLATIEHKYLQNGKKPINSILRHAPFLDPNVHPLLLIVPNPGQAKTIMDIYLGTGSSAKQPSPIEDSVEVIASLNTAEEPTHHIDELDREGTGFEPDPQKRRAIELYAVKRARNFYENDGYKVIEKGKPYDLHCTKGDDVLHVEVKGSRGPLSALIVTKNEIADARNSQWKSDLFLVREIILGDPVDEIYAPTGGRDERRKGWVPKDEDLTPIQYRYTLPQIPEAG